MLNKFSIRQCSDGDRMLRGIEESLERECPDQFSVMKHVTTSSWARGRKACRRTTRGRMSNSNLEDTRTLRTSCESEAAGAINESIQRQLRIFKN